MGQYLIKELEKLSGIKAHTIRIWEKRYGIVEPQRSQTNIRYYSDEDLKKIINVSLLNNNGLKISKIALLSSGEIANKVAELSQSVGRLDVHIDRLIVAMVDIDEAQFHKVMQEMTAKYGFESTISEIVYPFLEKIGVLWQTGNISPAQEHFISNLLRQKILAAIDALPIPPRSRPGVVLFLPEGELHELGLLFYHYIARKSGFHTYYLGQTVPFKDIVSLSEKYSPAYLVTSITSSPAPNLVEGYLTRLCAAVPKSKVLSSGLVIRKTALKMPKNLHLYGSIRELKALLVR